MADQIVTEEDVFNDDKDPIEAIYEIRRNSKDSTEENMESLQESVQESSKGSGVKEEIPDELEDPVESKKTEEEEEEEDPGKESLGSKKVFEDGKTEVDPEDEGKSEEGEKEDKTVTSKVRKYSADGKEYEFTEDEIFDQFGTVFGKAMNYTQKMQKIAPYRKMISAMEEEGITESQFNTAIDALKGNKDAIQSLMKTHNIDPLDIDGESEGESYSPTQYGKSEYQQRIEEVTGKISSDPEYVTTVDVIQNKWDSASRSEFSKNPDMISGLHNDIKSGLYDKVMPVAAKMKVLDGNSKSDIEYYMLAGQEVSSKENSSKSSVDDANNKTQEMVDKSGQASSEAQRKRAAASTRTRADKKGVTDYLEDDNDEHFDDWYKKLMSKN
jgi:hypothetical protein